MENRPDQAGGFGNKIRHEKIQDEDGKRQSRTKLQIILARVIVDKLSVSQQRSTIIRKEREIIVECPV